MKATIQSISQGTLNRASLSIHRHGTIIAIFCCVTAALIVKHSSIFAIFPLLVWWVGYRRTILLLLSSGIVFLLTFAPFAGEGSAGILSNVFLYKSWRLPYGTQLLFEPTINTAIMALAVFLAPLLTRRMPLERALLVGVLAWLVFTSGISTNYLYPLIAVAALNAPRDRRWLPVVSVIVAALEMEYTGLLPAFPAALKAGLWMGLWFVLVAWLWGLVRHTGRAASRTG